MTIIVQIALLFTLIGERNPYPVMPPDRLSSECDIAAFYEGVEPPEADMQVLTSSGALEEVEVMLIPTRVDKGNYVVKLTREGRNLYKVETRYSRNIRSTPLPAWRNFSRTTQKTLYIQTRYCSEYARNEEVVLRVEGTYGYDKGTILFD